MSEIIEMFQYPFVVRALIATCLVGLMCGVLGVFIVLRNMSLIGDALSHAILPGVVFAFMAFGYSTIAFFTGSVLAGLVSVILMTWIQQNVNTKNDASIGIVFTAMFSIGVIGISAISQKDGVHLDLKDFLVGDINAISTEDIYLTFGICVYVLLCIIVFYRYLFVTTFQPVIAETMGISVKTLHYFLMLLLSLAVVASIRAVGMILVVAMLITPAATALLLSDKLKKVIALAGFIGMFSAAFGLILSVYYNTPPGPAMVVVGALLYTITVFFAPKKGLVFSHFRKQQLQRKIQIEDILKQSLKLTQQNDLSLENLLQRVGFGKGKLLQHLKSLQKQSMVLLKKDHVQLTEKGVEQANRMVRAHRLWETYLVNRIGLTAEQIHEDAEKYEHLLTDELLDEMDAALNYPDLDPHGSPIPKRSKKQ